MELKFETLKQRAKAIITGDLSNQSAGFGPFGLMDDACFAALAQMAAGTYFVEERPALVAFAKAYGVENAQYDKDRLATHARSAMEKIAGFRASDELALITLKAREEAIKLIDGWDVRRVSALVDLFPAIVPKKYQAASLSCYMADNDDADWMVSFDPDQPRLRCSDDDLSYVTRGVYPSPRG